MEYTGWKVVQGFVLWVGIFLALWRVDGWVILWSLLERFWVSFVRGVLNPNNQYNVY